MKEKYLKFFFAVLSENKIEAVKIKKTLKPSDWQKVLDFAKKSGFGAIFFHYLLKFKLIESVPKKIALELKNLEILNWQQNLINQKQFLKITDFCRKQKIKIIPIKGLSFSKLIYQNLHFRQASVDFDFLIAKKDVATALIKLKKIGYNFHDANRYSPEKILEERGEVLLAKKNHLNLDLHWRARNDDFAPKFGNHLLKSTSFDQSLKNEELLIFIAQSLAPDFESDFFQLKYLFDIHYLIKTKKINWAKTIKIAKNYDLEFILYFALTMSRYFFRTPLSEKYLARIKPNFIRENILKQWVNPEKILKYQKRKIDNYQLWYYIGINLLFSKNLTQAVLIIMRKIKKKIKND